MWSINVNLRLLKASVEFVRWGGWGLHSHFRVLPNFSVEVVLCFLVVGAVTISSWVGGVGWGQKKSAIRLNSARLYKPTGTELLTASVECVRWGG